MPTELNPGILTHTRDLRQLVHPATAARASVAHQQPGGTPEGLAGAPSDRGRRGAEEA